MDTIYIYTGLINWELLNVAQLMGFISLVSNNGWYSKKAFSLLSLSDLSIPQLHKAPSLV